MTTFSRKMFSLPMTRHGILEYLVSAAETCTFHDAGVRIDDTVVAYLDIALYIGERIYGDVLANLGLRVYVCLFADVTHSYVFFKS